MRQGAQSRCGAEPSCVATQADQRAVHIAIDGNVLKGTGKHVNGGEKPQKPVLHVSEAQTGMGVHHCPSAEKPNEVRALKPLGTEVPWKGRTFPADAAQRSHECGRLVKRAGGEVILLIKDKTPLTRADRELFFEDPQADPGTWRTVMVAWRGVRCSPALISLSMWIGNGEKSGTPFVCSGSARRLRKAAWRSSLV